MAEVCDLSAQSSIHFYSQRKPHQKVFYLVNFCFFFFLYSVLGDLPEDPEEAWSITRDTILTTAAENIPVKRAVRRHSVVVGGLA